MSASLTYRHLFIKLNNFKFEYTRFLYLKKKQYMVYKYKLTAIIPNMMSFLYERARSLASEAS